MSDKTKEFIRYLQGEPHHKEVLEDKATGGYVVMMSDISFIEIKIVEDMACFVNAPIEETLDDLRSCAGLDHESIETTDEKLVEQEHSEIVKELKRKGKI